MRESRYGAARFQGGRKQGFMGVTPKAAGSVRAKRLRVIFEVSEETKIPLPKLRQRYNTLSKLGFDPARQPVSLLFPDDFIARLKKASEARRKKMFDNMVAHLTQKPRNA